MPKAACVDWRIFRTLRISPRDNSNKASFPRGFLLLLKYTFCRQGDGLCLSDRIDSQGDIVRAQRRKAKFRASGLKSRDNLVYIVANQAKTNVACVFFNDWIYMNETETYFFARHFGQLESYCLPRLE